MTMYAATEVVLRRAEELGASVLEALARSGVADVELPGRAADVLAGFFDAELTVWCAPDLGDAAAVAGIDLAATWVAMGRQRYMAAAVEFEELVGRSWPDKAEVWNENHMVATAMGATSGDWPNALKYLQHYTEELLGRPLDQ